MLQFVLAQDKPAVPAPAPAPSPAPVAPMPTSVTDAANKLSDQVKRNWDWLLTWLETYGPGVLAALVLLVFGWLLAGWARRMVIRAFDRAKIDLTLGKFFGNLTRWTIIGFAVVTSLGTLGISTTGFAALIGTAGVAIALALQGNLSNLASGVLLLIFRPFKIGDAVIVAGQTGVVDGIDLFTTNLDTADNRRIIVPNAAIFGGVIENQTRHPRRVAAVNVVVSPAADIEQTRAVLQAAVGRVTASVKGALADPAPGVALAEIAPVTWATSVWAETAQHPVVRQALLREVKMAVDQAKLGVPGPAMDVRITSMPERAPGN